MKRPVAGLLALALLASCKPPAFRAEAVFLDGGLAFVDSAGGVPNGCWTDFAVIDASGEAAWRFEADGTGDCGPIFPLRYGRPPPAARSIIAARPLEPGRLYVVVGAADGEIDGAFALTRAGRGLLVHDVDPDSPPAAAIRERWWRAGRTRSLP